MNKAEQKRKEALAKVLDQAIAKELCQKEITQFEVSEQLAVHNGHLWGTVKSGSVKLLKLCQLCEQIGMTLMLVSADGETETELTVTK
jgi:hypothetical protein